MNMNLSPCKDCEKRYVGCHSECEQYKEFRVARDEFKKEKEQRNIMTYYVEGRITQLSKKYHHRGGIIKYVTR